MVSAFAVLKHPVRGRERELAAVAALLGAAQRGAGGSLVIIGPAGSGKTTLLAAAAVGQPAAFDVRAAGGRAGPGRGGREVRRIGVAGCAAEAGLDGALAARLLECRGEGPAVLAALRRLAADGPLVCCVDDAQWVDGGSLAALAYAARRVAGDPIALVFAAGPAEDAAEHPPGPLDDLDRLVIGPLDEAAGRQVLRDLVPEGVHGDVAGVVTGLAQGNPRALVDLAGVLTPAQRRGDDEPPDRLPEDSPLRRGHLRRLRALPAATRAALLLVAAEDAVLPGRAVPVARGVAALEAAGLSVSALQPAERAGLIRVDAGGMWFPPPLFGPVVYGEATLAERYAAHRVLSGGSGQETRLRGALHRAALATGADERLAGELAAAAPAEHGPAARALRRAAELSADPGRAGAWRLAAARRIWRAGLPHRARLLLRTEARPAAAPPAALAAERELLLAEIELHTGVAADGNQALRAAAERLAAATDGPATGPEPGLGILMLAGEVLCGAGDQERAAGIVARLARRQGPVGAELLTEHFAGLAALFAGAPAAAVRPLRRVLTLAGALREPAALIRAALAGLLIGDDAQAHRLATRAAALARDAGELATVPQALEIAASADFALGGFDAAVSTGLEGLRLARTTGQDNVANNHLGLLAVLAAMVGDRAGCVARVHASRARSGVDVDSPSWALGAWALSLLDVADGRHRSAVARLLAVTRAEAGDGVPAAARRGGLVVRVAAAPTLVEAAVGADRPRLAEEALRGFAVWAASTANPTWLALVARCRALVAGSDDEAAGHYAEALRLHVLGDSDFAMARTELLYGQRLRRGRRPAAAREHLERALETFEHFGAGPWAARAGAELRAAGSPVGREPARRSAGGGPPADDVLTAQQRRIAGLVAEGATNREIAAAMVLSPRTVDHHLRNIFVRLGVRSRTELAKVCRT